MAEGTETSRVAVVGVGGYAGAELARLLFGHPRREALDPVFFSRTSEGGTGLPVPLENLHPHLAHPAATEGAAVVPFAWTTVEEARISVVFLALPHEVSREDAGEWIRRGVRVIDLSGAWRLQEERNRAVYKLTDPDPVFAQALQEQAVYGCPELHRTAIREARLVANPGCYATSIILALAPLLKAGLVDVEHGIVCDSKSGVSGAGKTPSATTHFMHAADNLSAYAVFGHRHSGELLEQLQLSSDQIQFTPHLLPIPRGILSTIYVWLRERTDPEQIESCLRRFYADRPMVRVRSAGTLPEIQHVVRTNFCDLGFALAPDGKRLVFVSCLDNLLKGASGQAMQNMNLMFGWKEEEGLL